MFVQKMEPLKEWGPLSNVGLETMAIKYNYLF